jgi:hypothetical protein
MTVQKVERANQFFFFGYFDFLFAADQISDRFSERFWSKLFLWLLSRDISLSLSVRQEEPIPPSNLNSYTWCKTHSVTSFSKRKEKKKG